MDQLEAIQRAVASLLEKAENASVGDLASAVEKASGAMRLSVDLEKSQAELRKLALEQSKLQYENDCAKKRERSEQLKEYVSLLAPFVTIMTLAATLIVQGWQFRQSEKDKSAAAEDAQWADAVKTISQTSKLAPGVIALNPFLKSAKYRELARDTAVQLLANSSDAILFTDLFGAAFVPVGWSNLDQVLKLDRALIVRGSPLWTKSYDPATDRNDIEKLTSEEKEAYDYTNQALRKICSEVASVLRAPRPRGTSLDLSAARFYGCDWSGVDLSGGNIESVAIAAVNLKDANLDAITQFEGAYFYADAWWEAKKVSPQLLTYLENNDVSKYKPNGKYGPTSETVSLQQYITGLNRLKHQGL